MICCQLISDRLTFISHCNGRCVCFSWAQWLCVPAARRGICESWIRRCARLTCCTAFGRTHRSCCLFVWLFTSGMRSVGEFRRFDVEQLKRPRHLPSRSDQSRKKPELYTRVCD